MAKILISILSDQLIPNYLFIKESACEYDKLLFISTQEMEKKKVGENLEITLNIPPKSVKRIVTSEYDYSDILGKLDNEHFKESDKYCINQTGGTKVLSIALYEYFQKYNARFVYLPIGKNICYDLNKVNSIPIKYRMNLKEYLSLFGLEYNCENKLTYGIDKAKGIFDRIKRSNFQAANIYKIKNAQLLENPTDKRYYGGAWFEDYVFFRIKEEYNLDNHDIGKSVKVFKRNSTDIYNDNEIDVVFVWMNSLYVIECKASISSLHTSTSINNYLYKLAAVCKDLGLRVNSYLFTTIDISQLKEPVQNNIEKRRSILNITKIVDGTTLSQPSLNL